MKGQKNDYNDTEAIAEAALRPNLRTVHEKTQDQLDLQACRRSALPILHDARSSRWLDARLERSSTVIAIKVSQLTTVQRALTCRAIMC